MERDCKSWPIQKIIPALKDFKNFMKDSEEEISSGQKVILAEPKQEN